MQGNLLQDKAIQFILGGNALFTMRSVKTGVRFTYKVLIDSRDETTLRVSLLSGTDNTRDYKMIGKIQVIESMPKFTPISNEKTPSIEAFDHVFLNLLVKFPMPSLELWHEGRCCRCGRVLTVPESIELGIGPECIFKVARFAI